MRRGAYGEPLTFCSVPPKLSISYSPYSVYSSSLSEPFPYVSCSNKMKESDTQQSKQHCWECRRRRLVCDFTQPGCTRCATTGVTCPGYGPSQPVSLRWLPPGKVRSRNIKPKKKQVERTEKKESTLPVNANPVMVQSPCTEITTLAHMLVEAADYCMLHPWQVWINTPNGA